jgi:hypothetical protein
MSLREDTLAAIQAVLVAAGVASGRVYRTRQEAIVTLPAVVIEPQRDEAEPAALGRDDHRLTVAIHTMAKGDTPDSAANTTITLITSTLTGNRTLGLSNCELLAGHSIEWDFQDFDLARATMSFTYHLRGNF